MWHGESYRGGAQILLKNFAEDTTRLTKLTFVRGGVSAVWLKEKTNLNCSKSLFCPWSANKLLAETKIFHTYWRNVTEFSISILWCSVSSIQSWISKHLKNKENETLLRREPMETNSETTFMLEPLCSKLTDIPCLWIGTLDSIKLVLSQFNLNQINLHQTLKYFCFS